MEQLSEDGKWRWNGAEWVPNESSDSMPSPAAEDVPVAAEDVPVAAEAVPVVEAPIATQEPVQAMPTMADTSVVPAGDWAIQTAEYGMFFTKLLGFLLKVITLGFGLPWAKCMVINKWSRNVRIDGRSIQFTGTPMGLFGIWVKICILSIITLTLYYWFAGYKQVAKYIDSHIIWA